MNQEAILKAREDFRRRLPTLVRDSGWTHCSREKEGAQWLDQTFGAGHFHCVDDMGVHLFIQKTVTLVEEIRLEDREKFEEEITAKTDEQLKRAAETILVLEVTAEQLRAELQRLRTPVPGEIWQQGSKIVVKLDHSAIENNGVTRPKTGHTSLCWNIWDEMTRSAGKMPVKAEAVPPCVAQGVKEATAGAAYSQWCRFCGVNPKDHSKPWVAKEKEAPLPSGVPQPAALIPAQHVVTPPPVLVVEGAPGDPWIPKVEVCPPLLTIPVFVAPPPSAMPPMGPGEPGAFNSTTPKVYDDGKGGKGNYCVGYGGIISAPPLNPPPPPPFAPPAPFPPPAPLPQ